VVSPTLQPLSIPTIIPSANAFCGPAALACVMRSDHDAATKHLWNVANWALKQTVTQ
jgi:hypothetical protein